MHWDVNDSLGQWIPVSPQQETLESLVIPLNHADERWRGKDLFFTWDVSVYITSPWGKEFLAVPLSRFSLGEPLVGHSLNGKTHWASHCQLGRVGLWGGCSLSLVLPSSALSLRAWSAVQALYSLTSLSLSWRPLPHCRLVSRIMHVLLELWLLIFWDGCATIMVNACTLR